MVTRDYAVVEGERPKAKVVPKRKKKRETAAEDEQEPLPPPKPAEPEPPSSFSNVPANGAPDVPPDAPALLPEVSPPPGSSISPRRSKRPVALRVDPPKPRRRELHPWWGHVQLNVNGGFREDGTKQFSPELSWNPTFSFEGNFRLRPQLGVTALKNDLNQYFPILEPALFASFGGGAFRIEPGAGMQVWFGQGGVYPLLQLNLAVAFEGNQETPKFFERLFVAPAILFSPILPIYLVKAGFGFAF